MSAPTGLWTAREASQAQGESDMKKHRLGAGDSPLENAVSFTNSPRSNRLLTLDELRRMPRPKALIKGVLYSDMEHNLFGPQGVSKTFLLIDCAMHMAYGRSWMGRKTRRARTLVICGEGGGRLFADRVDAWLTHYEISDDTAVCEAVRVTEYPVAMLDPSQVDGLLKLIATEQGAGGFDLIAIDTLMGNFGSGDENAQADMVAFCHAMRRIRLVTRAGVLVVHHTGHADRTRPQGGNALRRNIDIELRVDRDERDPNLCGVMGGGELKSRHDRGIGLISYRLEIVETGSMDDDGDAVTSCVIVPTHETPSFAGKNARGLKLSKNQRIVVDALRAFADRTGQDMQNPDGVHVATTEFYCECKKAGLLKQRANGVRKSFLERGWLVEVAGGFRWIFIDS